MLPVLSAEQVRNADSWTIDKQGISSLDLMERAAERCAAHILLSYRKDLYGPANTSSFLVMVGMGNNGGDGLVIARILHEAGVSVRVIRIRTKEKASPDNQSNWERVKALKMPIEDLDLQLIRAVHFADNEVIVDAVFGTGLSAPIEGPLSLMIEQLNNSGRPVIAIDLPSGLFAEDNSENDAEHIVRATETLTFEVPKLALLLPENAHYTGSLRIIPIGLEADFIGSQPTPYRVLEEKDVRALVPMRPSAGHKGTFGHAGIIAGSDGKYGAAILCTRAALRSGVGLVSVRTNERGLPILQGAVPEAMCSVDPRPSADPVIQEDAKWTSLGVGPGLGTSDAAVKTVKNLIQEGRSPMVLDADALNILAENPTWLAFLPDRTVLTPHPREFDRLWGEGSRTGYERLGRAREFAQKNGCILVLKGAWTAICDPEGRVFFNPTGNNGMAKGGSGDALTGLLTGLLAQGIAPLNASLLAVYLHGFAGDLVAERKSKEGMTPGDLIAALPEAWKALHEAL